MPPRTASAGAGRTPAARGVVGWTAVALNTAVAGIWAFWGAIESFHEGWYAPGLLPNLLFTLAHLIPMLIFVSLGLLALRRPRIGAVVYLLVGGLLGGWFLSTRSWSWDPAQVGLGLLMGGFGGVYGVLWWFGRPRPRRWAYHLIWGVPVLIAVVSGLDGAYRVATRHDDGDRGVRIIEGADGLRLLWAPAGPGWPRGGISWEEAVRRCAHLIDDGLTRADAPQNIWRLPTVEEVVRSMTRDGANAGGEWDPRRLRATYSTRPDKETPLWDPSSPVIYWWAADEVDEDRAYRVVYHGGVYAIRKETAPGSQGFRAVRDLP